MKFSTDLFEIFYVLGSCRRGWSQDQSRLRWASRRNAECFPRAWRL